MFQLKTSRSIWHNTNISSEEHHNIDQEFIKNNHRKSHNKCRACKKRSDILHQQFLNEKAKLMASKLCAPEEKALKAILQAEESKKTFSIICGLIGKQQVPLTQVDILNMDTTSPHKFVTLTSKTKIKKNVLSHNKTHSLQANATPFMSHPILKDFINPSIDAEWIDELLDGLFIDNLIQENSLSDIQQSWIKNLQFLTESEISLDLSVAVFRSFFKRKQEWTASSPSRCHMVTTKPSLNASDVMAPWYLRLSSW